MQAIDAAVRFQDSASEVLSETSDLTSALATNVVLAREYLKEVEISPDQVRDLAGWQHDGHGLVSRGKRRPPRSRALCMAWSSWRDPCRRDCRRRARG